MANKILKTHLGALVQLDSAVSFLLMSLNLSLAFRTEMSLLEGLYKEVQNLQMNQEHQFEKTLNQVTGSNQTLSSSREAKENMQRLMLYQEAFRASYKKLKIITGEYLTSIYPALSSQEARRFQLAEAFKQLTTAWSG